jgi:hypothetical protein
MRIKTISVELGQTVGFAKGFGSVSIRSSVEVEVEPGEDPEVVYRKALKFVKDRVESELENTDADLALPERPEKPLRRPERESGPKRRTFRHND